MNRRPPDLTHRAAELAYEYAATQMTCGRSAEAVKNELLLQGIDEQTATIMVRALADIHPATREQRPLLTRLQRFGRFQALKIRRYLARRPSRS